MPDFHPGSPAHLTDCRQEQALHTFFQCPGKRPDGVFATHNLSDEVQEWEQEDPDHINDVPVQTTKIHWREVPAAKMPSH